MYTAKNLNMFLYHFGWTLYSVYCHGQTREMYTNSKPRKWASGKVASGPVYELACGRMANREVARGVTDGTNRRNPIGSKPLSNQKDETLQSPDDLLM